MDQIKDKVNSLTSGLQPYPMDELSRKAREHRVQGRPVFDFGTGDPTLPTELWLIEHMVKHIPSVSQYPSVLGSKELDQAHRIYLKNRFQLPNDLFHILPTRGSKEAIFHIPLSLVGRAGGRKTIAYPVPGYPIYEPSILYAQGTIYPTTEICPEPWLWPKSVQNDLCAIWVNLPHNPTGFIGSKHQRKNLIDYCRDQNVILLSDECYVDIYDPDLPEIERPGSFLEYGPENLVVFMSLSKRSGLTGYRAGFMAGDPFILGPHAQSRSRFGLAQVSFIQALAVKAWEDEKHVEKRREVFFKRLNILSQSLTAMGFEAPMPKAGIYIWARLPKSLSWDDVEFCQKLFNQTGLVFAPGQWLGAQEPWFVRLACVPDEAESLTAMDRLAHFLK